MDVKNWAFTHVECSACGRCFLPWEVKHKMSHLNHQHPMHTCSQVCDDEVTRLFNAIADSQTKEVKNGNRE